VVVDQVTGREKRNEGGGRLMQALGGSPVIPKKTNLFVLFSFVFVFVFNIFSFLIFFFFFLVLYKN
jgi:hypothetical protein